MNAMLPSLSDSTRRRLTPLDRDRDLLPFRRARQLVEFFLYWLPVSAFPARVAERQWLLEFLDRFSIAAAQFGLREELFVQMKAAADEPLRSALFRNQQLFTPIPGLSRRPGAKLPGVVTMKEVKEMQDGKRAYKPDEMIPDYCYWFLHRSADDIRPQLFGYGAMTIGFVEPDPNVRLPEIPKLRVLREGPIAQIGDLNAKIAMALALRDPFLARTKKVFGSDLEDDFMHNQMLFVLPRIGSRDCFERPAEEVRSWFEVFPIYLNESREDGGLLLASRHNLDELLAALLAGMAGEGWKYPEGSEP